MLGLRLEETNLNSSYDYFQVQNEHLFILYLVIKTLYDV
jgi:hypothetical protein